MINPRWRLFRIYNVFWTCFTSSKIDSHSVNILNSYRVRDSKPLHSPQAFFFLSPKSDWDPETGSEQESAFIIAQLTGHEAAKVPHFRARGQKKQPA